MTRWCAALAASILVVSSACHQADDMGAPVPTGAMSYSGYDAAGRLIATGWIRLDIVLADQAGPGIPTPLEFSGECASRGRS